MRKKLFTFLLALVAGIGSMWAQTPSGTCGENLTWEFNPETGALTISGTGTTMTSIGWVSGVWNEQVTSVTFPESLTSIEVMSAFQGFGMSTITLPENLTELGMAAFYQCGALTSIEIPAGVSTIQGVTFSQCSSLATVKLPASITSIADYAFADCPALTSFYSYAETPPTCESNKVFWDQLEWKPLNLSAARLYVPYNSIADYKAANGWNSFGTIAAIPGTEPAPATPTVYNSGSVALSNLKVGDILMAGVTLTDDSDSKVKFVPSRLKLAGNIRKSELTVAHFVNSLQTPLLGENAAMTFPGGVITITPIDEEGNDGNAWEVTEINVAVDIPVTLAGITYSGTTPATSDEDITANADPQNTGVYYSTFFDSANKYALPAGVEAYVAEVSSNALNLTKIAAEGDVLPANNAVILKSTVENFTLVVSDADPVSFTATNSLQGSDDAIATPDNCYVLSGADGVVGFYRYNGTNLNAHKAYVIYSGSPSNAPRRMPFVFNGEQTATGIDNASYKDGGSEKVLRDGQLVIIRNGIEYNANGQIVK